MDVPEILTDLGLAGEDFGPDPSTPETLAAGWRGVAPCPGRAALEAQWPATAARLARDLAARNLAGMDAAFVRVLDDVIDLLVARGVFAEADLPAAAQAKRAARAAERAKL